jgi:hypothetical protein
VSDRIIHYALLNNPPLRHAGKPDSTSRRRPRPHSRARQCPRRTGGAGLVHGFPPALWPADSPKQGCLLPRLVGMGCLSGNRIRLKLCPARCALDSLPGRL